MWSREIASKIDIGLPNLACETDRKRWRSPVLALRLLRWWANAGGLGGRRACAYWGLESPVCRTFGYNPQPNKAMAEAEHLDGRGLIMGDPMEIGLWVSGGLLGLMVVLVAWWRGCCRSDGRLDFRPDLEGAFGLKKGMQWV